VFGAAVDPAKDLAVCVFHGDHNRDADYQAYVDWLAELLVRYADRPKPVLVQMVDRGNPVPNAKWRIRIAEVTKAVPEHVLFVLVSDSTLVRGAALAIGWIAPRAYTMKVCASPDEAAREVESFRGEPVPQLIDLLESARHA